MIQTSIRILSPHGVQGKPIKRGQDTKLLKYSPLYTPRQIVIRCLICTHISAPVLELILLLDNKVRLQSHRFLCSVSRPRLIVGSRTKKSETLNGVSALFQHAFLWWDRVRSDLNTCATQANTVFLKDFTLDPTQVILESIE